MTFERGRRLLILAALCANAACVSGYQDALGYRARQAALRRDVDAFRGLMEEAAEGVPAFPEDNPEKTVLTHFLDLADDPRFLPIIEDWRARGWVSDLLTCAIQRARYRGMAAKDPIAAEEAAQVCLDRARRAATDAERSWEVEACLDGAPFLTVTGTAALAPYLALAGDPIEPRAFRAGLLRGMTVHYLQDADWRAMSEPLTPTAIRYAAAEGQLVDAARRLTTVLDSLRGSIDTTLLASATALGALELERASIAMDRSFLGSYLVDADTDREDLVWAWVRSLKAKKAIRRLEPLGIWNRKREPGGDAFWYGCAYAELVREHVEVRSVSVRALSRLEPTAIVERCKKKSTESLPSILGPYPLEASLRATLTASVAARFGKEHVILRALAPPG